jgi:hypothetical protein
MTTPTPRTDAKSVDQTIDGLKVWAVEERGAGNDSTALSLEAAAYLLGSLKRDLAARDAELTELREEYATATMAAAKWADRASAAERKAEEAARDAARWKVCLDAEGVAVSIFNCDPASWRYPEGDQLVAAIDAIRTGADNAWSVPIHKCEPVHDESPPHDAAIAAKGEA